jgi:hypothetical protein
LLLPFGANSSFRFVSFHSLSLFFPLCSVAKVAVYVAGVSLFFSQLFLALDFHLFVPQLLVPLVDFSSTVEL